MQTQTLLTPASITATGGGLDLDTSRLTGRAHATITVRNTAGTNPTLACKLQGSTGLARGYEYSTLGATATELREGATTNNKLALRFTQSGARSIKRVALYLDKQGSFTAGKKLTLTIETNNSGNPSGTAVTNGTSNTVDIDTEVSTTAGWVTFTFAKPVDLSDATVYHFVLAGDYTASATINVRWYSKTVASGGTFNTFDATNWAGVTATENLMAYADEYTFTDISGGGFTTVETALNTSVQTISLHARSLPQRTRIYSTVGGTDNPAFAVAGTLTASKVHAQ